MLGYWGGIPIYCCDPKIFLVIFLEYSRGVLVGMNDQKKSYKLLLASYSLLQLQLHNIMKKEMYLEQLKRFRNKLAAYDAE